jgi:hypothetical protein
MTSSKANLNDMKVVIAGREDNIVVKYLCF